MNEYPLLFSINVAVVIKQGFWVLLKPIVWKSHNILQPFLKTVRIIRKSQVPFDLHTWPLIFDYFSF